MKLPSSFPVLLLIALVSSATSAIAGSTTAGDHSILADDSSTANIMERDLQQSCDITEAYHPDYSLPWSEGKCILTTTCNSPSYATQLACCKGAYAGQTSNFCVSQLDNPPTSSPTKTGGPDSFYPNYDLPWSEGVCINTVPVPSGRPTYTSQLACCKAAYGGQVSNACINGLATPPTGSPTKAGAVGTDYYPDYSLAWPEGKCINTQPVPSGRPIYATQLACCKAAYGGQVSNACIQDLATPPTSAPTKVGGPNEFYPDYSLPWPEGVCINTVPVPSGRPIYSTQLACCQAAYGGQVSRACMEKASTKFTLNIKLTTGSTPDETSWSLFETTCTDPDDEFTTLESPPYTVADTAYSYSFSVPKSCCVVFWVRESTYEITSPDSSGNDRSGSDPSGFSVMEMWGECGLSG